VALRIGGTGPILVPEPGRVDSRRSVPASFSPGAALGRGLAVAWTALLLLSCASDGAAPHPDLAAVWRDFQALPPERALAIAGDPRRDRWVVGISAGHATRDEAETEALAQCRMRRALRRMQAACVLYAVGDEITWPGL
jgi:hypothetical protein